MTSPRPNLFLVGAMKSGTTSLHHYLGAHPQIFMSARKEPHYFSRNPEPGIPEPAYLALFAGGEACVYRGESSTQYTKAPQFTGAAERIATFEPSARILYLMRDPVERAISHYWWNWRSGAERRPMERAFREDPHYLAFSDYDMQLASYFEVFARDRIFTLTTEELARDPGHELRRCFDWLGVDTTFVPPNLNRRYRATGRYVPTENRLAVRVVRYMWSWLPVHATPRVKSEVLHWLGALVDRGARPTDTAVAYLAPLLQDKVERLRDRLRRDFPEWRTLARGTSSL